MFFRFCGGPSKAREREGFDPFASPGPLIVLGERTLRPPGHACFELTVRILHFLLNEESWDQARESTGSP